MNRKLKLSLICFLFIVLENHSFAEVDLTELVENIHSAVGTVITYDKNKKPLGQGSGFFIDANGHLITNYHVLAGAFHAEVRTYDGKSYPVKSVIGENKKMDLIKILVDIPRSSVQWIEATRTLPSVAERVVVIGSPMGLEQTVSEGIVSSVREIPEIGKILQISASISSGSSGGPVVNMKEQVIGVVSFYLIKGQNLNFAVPALYLLDLKPSKTIKTISEWTYGVDKKSLRKAPRQGRLFVHIEPKGARIRILNIKPKFYQGIVLKPGPYHIEVSSDGYKTKEVWIRIGPGQDKNLRISLKKNLHVLSEEQIITKTSEFFSKGIEHEFKGEYREAIDAYKECIQIDPDNRLCHMGLGEAYIRIDHYREAIDAFKECIRIDPYIPAFHFYMGRSYFNLGLHSKAIDECKLTIQYKPDDEMAQKTYVILGHCYGVLGHPTESIEAFKQAIHINPDHPIAYYGLGLAYLSHGDRSSAIDQYKILKGLDKEQANKLFDTIYR